MNPKHAANSNSGTDQDSFSIAYILKAHLNISGKIVSYCRVSGHHGLNKAVPMVFPFTPHNFTRQERLHNLVLFSNEACTYLCFSKYNFTLLNHNT